MNGALLLSILESQPQSTESAQSRGEEILNQYQELFVFPAAEKSYNNDNASLSGEIAGFFAETLTLEENNELLKRLVIF